MRGALGRLIPSITKPVSATLLPVFLEGNTNSGRRKPDLNIVVGLMVFSGSELILCAEGLRFEDLAVRGALPAAKVG